MVLLGFQDSGHHNSHLTVGIGLTSLKLQKTNDLNSFSLTYRGKNLVKKILIPVSEL